MKLQVKKISKVQYGMTSMEKQLSRVRQIGAAVHLRKHFFNKQKFVAVQRINIYIYIYIRLSGTSYDI